MLLMNGLQRIIPPSKYIFNIRNKLKDLKLFCVNKSDWKIYPNLNEEGFAKCCESDGFRFIYIDYTGKTHDLRPEENKPSFNNFIKYVRKLLYKYSLKKNYIHIW
jgi:hypothetical protein